jgi:hypothetical protein
MRKAILVRLEGGLGNQMFQYSLGRRLSLKHDVPLLFDIESYKTNPIADCSFWLERFSIDIKNNLATPEELAYFKRVRMKKGRRFLFHNLLYADPARYIEEKHYWFDPAILASVKLPAMLHGWWQSEKYFLPIRETLLDDFSIQNIDGHNARISEDFSSGETVALQIRRKDYVTNPKTKAYHGELPMTYYQEGFLHIKRMSPAALPVIFSDDVEWVRENLPLPKGAIHVDWNGEDKTGSLNMWLISKCRHQVIGNSSFGWWGAWLNQYPKKQVIAPRPWVAAMTSEQTRDVVPQDWISRDVNYIRS